MGKLLKVRTEGISHQHTEPREKQAHFLQSKLWVNQGYIETNVATKLNQSTNIY